LEGWWIFFGARGTRAHVRNVPSPVLPKSTVQNMVDHDSRKRVAKNFLPFFFKNFSKNLKILQRFHHAQKRTPHPHPPNNTELGPGICMGICPKSPKSTRISLEGWWIFFARAARALLARARMFVTSQVPFFPNQQYTI
jgi:hypothetical protein